MRLSERALMSIATLALTALGLASCGGAQPITGEFVGPAQGQADVLVAIVAKEGQVIAYACDGKNVAEWFTGQRDGNRFTLDSVNSEARLVGEIGEAEVTGSLTFKDGTEAAFRSARSKGAAGLYALKITEGPASAAIVEGLSGLGTKLDARFADEVLAGTLTLPDGKSLEFRSRKAGDPPPEGIWRVIFTEVGEARGFQQKLQPGTTISSISLTSVPLPTEGFIIPWIP